MAYVVSWNGNKNSFANRSASANVKVGHSELIAELAAIDADASSCAGSPASSNKLGVERNKWVEHHRHHIKFTQ